MTPRERTLASLRRRTPDRVPLDLGGTESSGMTAIAYNRLRRHLGLGQGATQVFDPYQQVVKIEPDLRAALGVDTVPLLIEPRKWRPDVLSDGSPCHVPDLWRPQTQPDGSRVAFDDAGRAYARMPAGGLYFEPVNPPLASATTPADLDRLRRHVETFDWPDFADESLNDLAARARELFERTHLAIVANLQLHLLAAGQILRGTEQFLTDLLLEPQLATSLLGRLTDAYVERCDRYLAAVGPYVQVVLVNDDLGTQAGPMISPDCYRRMILPHQRRLFGHIKKRCDASLLLHSCGSVAAFIPDLISAGVDALNPVQVSAAGMDTASLKREFGRDLTFWGGGCDTQSILSRGTPRQVRAEVARRITDLKPGGGFVFTQVHNIQPDVPPENVVAMLDAYRDHAGY